MDIKKVLVVGAGTMGNGIAQVCAQKGLSVVLSDISEKMLEKAVGNIRWSVSKLRVRCPKTWKRSWEGSGPHRGLRLRGRRTS